MAFFHLFPSLHYRAGQSSMSNTCFSSRSIHFLYQKGAQRFSADAQSMRAQKSLPCTGPEHVDFLKKQGDCRRKQIVFLPYQHAAGGVFRIGWDKAQAGAAVNGKSPIQTKSTAHALFHQQGSIGEERIAEGNFQILFLPANPA